MSHEPKNVKAEELFLYKLQTTFGTAETTLNSTHYIDALPESSIENDAQIHEIDRADGTFGQPAAVFGDMPVNCSLSFYLRTNGAGDPGYWSDPIQCARFKETDDANVFTYTPTNLRSEFKDGTCWYYTGNRDTSQSLLEKGSNLMFNWEIEIPTGGVPKLNLSDGKGVHGGAHANATQPTCTDVGTSASAVIGATMSIGGESYKVITASVMGNQDVVSTMDQSATYGHGYTLPTAAKIKWSATVYLVNVSDATPLADLIAGTLTAWSIQWGVAPYKFTLSSPNDKCQITSVKKSEQDGVQVFELEGLFVDNDFTIDVDTST